LNAIGSGSKRFDELKGYEEAFQGSQPQQAGWQDMTNENDKDILEGLGRKDE
jgi:hypothetical protein